MLPDESVTLAGHDTDTAEGTVADSEIVPAKPERLAKVRASTAEEPAVNAIDDGPVML